MRRRAALLWVVLLAAYASTLGLDAFAASDYGGDEPHYLLSAHSLVEDGDLDVGDDHREREYLAFYPYLLDRHGVETEGRLHEPHGPGFPALLAPAFAVGGARGAELFLAGLAALAGAAAYLLAARVVPDPWALGAALAVGLSPPFVAYGTAVYPELAAGAALAGAALLALRLDARSSRWAIFACFGLIATLPWLGMKFLAAGAVIAYAAVSRLRRERRRLLALAGFEVVALSVAACVGVNQALYGGPTPYAADEPGETATDATFPMDYLGRAYRIVALLVDREYGLLRWAPVLALALGGLWLLYRSRREGLGRAIAAHREAQSVAALCGLALGAQFLVAAFLAPTMFGFWFPPRHLLAGLPLAVPLVAWGLRHAPRTGTALSLIGVAASAWLYVDVRVGEGGLVLGRPDAPWGPLVGAFPFFGDSPLPYALAAAAAVAAALLLLLEARHWRQTAGATRTRYSG